MLGYVSPRAIKAAWVVLGLGLLVMNLLIMFSPREATAAGPQLTIVGNGGKCSLSSGNTFRFVGRGFKPNGKVMVLVFYPKGEKDPRYGYGSNPYGFYSFHHHFGVYPTNARGSFRSNPWDCRFGPNNTQDPTGRYSVVAVDLAARAKMYFRVTP